MALGNGQQVIQGAGLPHALSFSISGGAITVPAPTSVPDYITVSAAQYTLLQADVQFSALVTSGKIKVTSDVPTNYVQQAYVKLKTIQEQLNWCKALIITLGGPVLP